MDRPNINYEHLFHIIGSIRVYCRVRPFLHGQSDGVSTVDYIGENGNLMIVHPHKQGRDARKVFSFNKVFGTNATQRKILILSKKSRLCYQAH